MNLTYTSARSLSYSYTHSSLRSTGLEKFSQYGKSAKIVSVSRRCIFFSRKKNAHFPLWFVYSSVRKIKDFSSLNCLFLSQKDQRFFQPGEQKLPKIWNRNRICRLSANLIISRCCCFLMPRKPVYIFMFCSVPLLPGEHDNALKSLKFLSVSFLCMKPSTCLNKKTTWAQYQELEKFVQGSVMQGCRSPAASPTHLTSVNELRGDCWYYPTPLTPRALVNDSDLPLVSSWGFWW